METNYDDFELNVPELGINVVVRDFKLLEKDDKTWTDCNIGYEEEDLENMNIDVRDLVARNDTTIGDELKCIAIAEMIRISDKYFDDGTIINKPLIERIVRYMDTRG